jgi:hypothetical protein
MAAMLAGSGRANGGRILDVVWSSGDGRNIALPVSGIRDPGGAALSDPSWLNLLAQVAGVVDGFMAWRRRLGEGRQLLRRGTRPVRRHQISGGWPTCETGRVKLAPVYPVRSGRLMLRPLTEPDVDDLVEYRSLPEVCRYVPFEPQSAGDVIARMNGAWRQQTLDQEGDSITLGAELVESGKLIGDVMVRWLSAEHSCGEIGYVFSPAYSGRGQLRRLTPPCTLPSMISGCTV